MSRNGQDTATANDTPETGYETGSSHNSTSRPPTPVNDTVCAETFSLQYLFQTIANDLQATNQFNYYHFQAYLTSLKGEMDWDATKCLLDAAPIFQETGALHDLVTALKKQGDRLQHSADAANTSMDITLGVCNMITVALAVVAVVLPPSQLLTLLASSHLLAWNFWDGTAGFVAAWDQLSKKQKKTCAALVTVSLLLIGCNVVYILSLPTVGVIAGSLGTALATAGATLGTSFVSGGFAACMFIVAGIEHGHYQKSLERIDHLSKKLTKLNSDGPKKKEDETETVAAVRHNSEKRALYNTLLTEKATAKRHKENVKIWSACGIAMTAATVAGALIMAGVVGTATFGVVPAVVGFICLVIAIKHYRTNKKALDVTGLKKSGDNPSPEEITAITKKEEAKPSTFSCRLFRSSSSIDAANLTSSLVQAM